MASNYSRLHQNTFEEQATATVFSSVQLNPHLQLQQTSPIPYSVRQAWLQMRRQEKYETEKKRVDDERFEALTKNFFTDGKKNRKRLEAFFFADKSTGPRFPKLLDDEGNVIQDYEQVQLQEEAMDAVKRRNKMKAETVTYVNGLGGFRQQQIRVIPEAMMTARRVLVTDENDEDHDDDGEEGKRRKQKTKKDFASNASSSSSSSDSDAEQASRLKKELLLISNQPLPPPQHRFLAKDREEHPSEHDEDNHDGGCYDDEDLSVIENETIKSSPNINNNNHLNANAISAQTAKTVLQKFSEKKRKVERHRIEMERNFSAELLRSSESKLLVKEILKYEKQEQISVNQHIGFVDGHVKGKKQNGTDATTTNGAASISQNHISSFTSASIEQRILQKKRDLFSYIRHQQKEITSSMNQEKTNNPKDLHSASSNSSNYLFNNNSYMNDDWASKIAAKAKQNLLLFDGADENNILNSQMQNNSWDDIAADRLVQQKIQALASVDTKGTSSWVEVEAKERQSSFPLLVCSPNSLLSSSLRQQNDNNNKKLVRKNTHPHFNSDDNLHSHHQLDSTVKSLTGNNNSILLNETTVTNNSASIATNKNNKNKNNHFIVDDGNDNQDFDSNDYEGDDHSEKSTAVHLRQVARRHHVERQIGMKRRIAEHLSNCRQKLSMLEAEEEKAEMMKKREEEAARQKRECCAPNGESRDDFDGNAARRNQDERDFLRHGGKIYRISTSNDIFNTVAQNGDDEEMFMANSRRETVVLLTEKSIVDKFNVLEWRRASLIELRRKSLEAV